MRQSPHSPTTPASDLITVPAIRGGRPPMADVEQDLMARRSAELADHVARWHHMLRQWSAPSNENTVWLAYAASYFMNTHGLTWAVDPVRLQNRVPEAPTVTAGPEMRDLSFVLLTHNHADHVDTDLWSQLASVDCHWVVPDHMLARFLGVPGMNRVRYTVAVAGQEVVLPGARIMPFASLHGELMPEKGFVTIPAMGYRVCAGNGDFLFPGDIRTYEPLFLTQFTGVSAVFAHVFLGRASALVSPPPLVEEFVTFYCACRPKKVVLTHLYELGREPEDCWRLEHAKIITQSFAATAGDVEVVTPFWLERVSL